MVSKREIMRKEMESQKLKEAKAKKILFGVVALVIAVCVTLVVVFIVKNADSFKSDDKGMANAEKPAGITPTGSFVVNGEGGVAPADTRQDDSKIRVQFLFDPMCPGCGIVDREMNERLMELVKNDEITLQMTPLAFLDRASSDNYSSRAGSAIATVADASPEHFYPFINAIFENQPEEGDAYVPVTNEDFAILAEDIGVSSSVSETFKEEKFVGWVKANTVFNTVRKDLFPKDDFSTPVAFIGGSETDEGTVSGAVRVDWTQDRTTEEAFNETLEEVKNKNE